MKQRMGLLKRVTQAERHFNRRLMALVIFATLGVTLGPVLMFHLSVSMWVLTGVGVPLLLTGFGTGLLVSLTHRGDALQVGIRSQLGLKSDASLRVEVLRVESVLDDLQQELRQLLQDEKDGIVRQQSEFGGAMSLMPLTDESGQLTEF